MFATAHQLPLDNNFADILDQDDDDEDLVRIFVKISGPNNFHKKLLFMLLTFIMSIK